MGEENRTEKRLYRILFLVSVSMLLINDWYLKYEYHNYLTGKLSDFAGLFAFPYFFSCFHPKRIKLIYLLSGVLFVFWKSDISQPIFDFAHSYGIGINRTVDYSDLIALSVLPFSYLYWKTRMKSILKPNKIFKPALIGICIFSFIATTLAAHYEDLNIKSEFSMVVNCDFDAAQKKIGVYSVYFDSREAEGQFTIQLEERNAEIRNLIRLQKDGDERTIIHLDSIQHFKVQGNGFIFYSGINKDDVKYMQGLSQQDIEKLFETQVRGRLSD